VLTWDAAPSLRVSGHLPSAEDGAKAKLIDVDIKLPEFVDRLSREALWTALATCATHVQGTELDRWRGVAGHPVVPVSFQSLPPIARRAFSRDIEVPASDPLNLGPFEATVLKDVRVVPGSESDAQEWLEWLQWEAVDDYVTPSLLEQKSREQRALFPHHHPRPLSASDLLTKARTERGDRSWFLLGPFDLGLWS